MVWSIKQMKLIKNNDFISAKAEEYNAKGNKEYEKRRFYNAIYFYTEGIKVKCKDDELNAKLYRKRASAYEQTGMILMRPLFLFLPHIME